MQGRVFVIGLGLIGGSLALCIKQKHPKAQITGYDINTKQCELGKMLGIIDNDVSSIQSAAVEADLILIATPVQETERIITILAGLPLKKGVLISDVGSTKAVVMRHAACLREKGIVFIGGHPMAGSHKSGVTAAKLTLFENAFYLLTPEPNMERELSILKAWLAGTNAKFLVITPEEHDYLTGIISHFPHVIAASLVHQAERSSRQNSLVTRLAAGGFRDITRIASSSPEMWRDITLHNKHVLLTLLEEWQEEMNKLAAILNEENADLIFEYFSQAKSYRDGMPLKEKGAIPSFYDLFVDVPDYPGIISEITGYLAKETISITNIRILETREDINGVLVISFQTEEDREKAERCIEHYTCYETSIGL